MADINVERKQRNIWPWIIGLIVLALLVWLLASMFGRDDEAEVPDDAVVVEAPAAAP
ncbi:MAG TPA: hypothetical protein VGR37_20835 [Longimicrobiaceae bacterium]|nr:hypothetical protein [Longimicrobiaceae bacterium]